MRFSIHPVLRRARREIAALALLASACGGDALLPPAPVELTVAAAGRGNGTLVSEPAGIACTIERGVASGSCRASFEAGRVVTLRAAAGAMSEFVGWGEACAATDSCEVAMAGARTVSPRFAGPRLRIVAADFSPTYGTPRGNGTVVITPGNLTCDVVDNRMRTPCEVEFAPGEPIAVTLDPALGESGVSVFSRVEPWPSVVCGPTGTTTPAYRLVCGGVPATATAELRVAMYRSLLAPNLSPTSPSTARGRVTSDVGGIDCRLTAAGQREGTCFADLPPGATTTLTFTPEPGSVFRSWGGDCGPSTGSTCTLTMDRPRRSFVVNGLTF